MKCIDAERLRKEVKGLEKGAHKSALGCADSETRKFHEGKDFAYQHVGILIDSLQQEQPDFPPINPNDAMKKLDEKIALVKERGTWKGVDVDKFMDEVRGREPACEELEKELDEFLKDHVFGKLINRNAGLALARHFAEWQSKQDKETIELAEDHAYLAGAVNEREKMMKEAVECRVDSKIVGHGHMEPGIEIDFFHGEFNVGDKVKVIIIKKDNG